MKALSSILAAALSLSLPSQAPAQSTNGYPAKPVRILVGSPPGGGTDILARLVAEKLGADLRQSFIVENRPGASNTIAADITARAEKDGLTLLLATTTAQAIAPHLLKLKFDPLKDLQPIGMVATVPNVLVVPTNSPYKSPQELAEALRSKPGQLKYASSGVGSTQHVGGAAFALATKSQAIHVPYKGSSQAHMDLLGGQLDFMFDTLTSALGQIRATKLKPLAVSSPQRSSNLPNVPTLDELGIHGANVTTWYALYTTGGTPEPVVTKLNAALNKVLASPDSQARIKALGGTADATSVSDFAKFNKEEFDRYGKLVASTGLKAE
ncbi:ABC transporter substrate-binding protein [Comamonas testosteroni]|uniref:ABC transporter substrate-binding protein n=2 Tax=Comamonas testosteroni TaxID=285 RepID=A0A096HB82_COMTE|nr:ABC transporter substrate-binding protein [Comamonas testosteroni]